MSKQLGGVPEGYEGITPYITVKKCEEAIDFYKRAFGAKEIFRMAGEDGKIGHAELKIGSGVLMLADEHPDFDCLSPETIGGTPFTMMVYVDDVDKFTETAVKEGLKTVRPVADQFYGDRSGHFEDPFGYKWCFATHVEDVSPEAMNERAASQTTAGGSDK
jgi:PhnB protein